ncbi:MAG TPA: radical SAM protein [Candidatus Woesearchaeota archaeon]|nr:radical SAM protein [Candidatus Woesearchaeota archaeon]
MMKILMIVPKYCIEETKFYGYPFPVGIGYIVSVVKKSNFDLHSINLNHFDKKVETVISDELDRNKYDVVMTGNNSMGYKITKRIIEVVKNHKTAPIFILGGAIITTEPEFLFEDLKPDIGVIGEGEETVVEVLKELEKGNRYNLHNIKGIIFREKETNKIFKTEPRQVIQNIDLIPFPDFEELGYLEFLENLNSSTDFCSNPFDSPKVYCISCSRSCPFQCTFCYHDNSYRQRSLDNIFQELEMAVKKYKINSIRTYDDCFSINKERLIEFCNRMIELKSKIDWELKWSCQMTVHSAELETLKLMKEAGCNVIGFGFESYSPAVLKSMKKPITPKMIDTALKNTIQAKIALGANFIFGDVAETKETAKETLDYWIKECKGQVGLSFIQPYTGSAIYYHCINKGIIKDKLDFVRNKMTTGIAMWYNMTDNMTDFEIKRLKKDVLDYQAKGCYFVSPIRIVKEKKPNTYKVTVRCPFCKQAITYRNFRIDFKYFFFYGIGSATVCRNCNMRFFIVSKIEKWAYKHYSLVRGLRDFLEEIKIKFKSFLLLR